MTKNDLVLIAMNIALMLGEAKEELRGLEEQAAAKDYDDYELEELVSEARGYVAGIETALNLIKTRLEQAA